MKRLIVVLVLLGSIAFAQAPAAVQLKVSNNHRWLQYSDGRPFFYLGDTAWHLFAKLNREEADLYLSNRAAKGFTVIQACVLNGRPLLDEPNAYGDKPLLNDDPTQPNEAYFRNVDYIVDKAAQLGLFIGMLPTWGANWQHVG